MHWCKSRRPLPEATRCKISSFKLCICSPSSLDSMSGRTKASLLRAARGHSPKLSADIKGLESSLSPSPKAGHAPRCLQMLPDASQMFLDALRSLPDVATCFQMLPDAYQTPPDVSRCNSKLNTRAHSQTIFREYSVVSPDSYFLRGIIVLHSGGNVSNACVPMFSQTCVLAIAENIANPSLLSRTYAGLYCYSMVVLA